MVQGIKKYSQNYFVNVNAIRAAGELAGIHMGNIRSRTSYNGAFFQRIMDVIGENNLIPERT